MHACLKVDEIIRLIAREVVASGAETTAVALACCCRDFEDPVLDPLWETQENLLPLLRSLPGDIWNGSGCTVSATTACISSFPDAQLPAWKSFKRFPTTLEFTRFRKNAQRMRKFEENGAYNVLSPELFSVLQLCTISEPLFPHLKTLNLWGATGTLIPFIPLFLSPGTTTINISFFSPNPPNVMVASMVTAFWTLCPNLRTINLHNLPRDPMITAAVSGMLLTSNRNTLRSFRVDSPLMEEACEVVYKLPDLRELSVVIERDTSLPLVVLPSLTDLIVRCGRDGDLLRMFRGATLGRLEAVTFISGSEQTGDFLEAFGTLALAVSAQNTLSRFYFYTPHPWIPNYLSLLPFTCLTHLVIESSCDGDCSSTVDDDAITHLARAMPKLRTLYLGDTPCHEIPTGVTIKGLVILANRCPDLSALRIHFQVNSLSTPPAVLGIASEAGPIALQRDCALVELEVGEIPIQEESVLTVALTLARIFPRIKYIDHVDDEGWQKVLDAICLSREIVDHSGEEHPLSAPRSNFSETFQGTTPEIGG